MGSSSGSGGVRDRIQAFEARSRLLSQTSPGASSSGPRSPGSPLSLSSFRTVGSPASSASPQTLPAVQHPLLRKIERPRPDVEEPTPADPTGASTRLARSSSTDPTPAVARPSLSRLVTDAQHTRSIQAAVSSTPNLAATHALGPTAPAEVPAPVPVTARPQTVAQPRPTDEQVVGAPVIDGLPPGQAQAYVHPLLRSSFAPRPESLPAAGHARVDPPSPALETERAAADGCTLDHKDGEEEDEDTHLLPTLGYGSSPLPSSPSTTAVGSSSFFSKPLGREPSSKGSLRATVDVDGATLHDDLHPRTTSHRPVPASKVFKRGALPLVIEHLDVYLNGLPSPAFTPPSLGAGTAPVGQTQHAVRPTRAERRARDKTAEGMFSPFERLEGGVGVGKYMWNAVGKKRVRFGWARPNTLVETITNIAVGVEGSAGVSSLYSLEGAYGAMQIVALLLTSVATLGQSDKVLAGWRKLILGDVPNIIALNFPSVFGQSLAFLLVYQLLALVLLWGFRREAKAVGSPNEIYEGFTAMRWTGWSRLRRARVMLAGFGLVILYLPMSTMAVRALVWSSDYWPLEENPYLASDDPVLPDGLNFCYTTTSTGGANWAPVILISSIISIGAVTVYFPVMLYRLINGNLPHVDRYTELGRRRGAREEDREYRRVLERDDNPLAFLYKGYRRRCGGYRAFYLLVKLSVLVVVAVFSKDNCLFRSVLPRATIEVIRQGVLLFFLLIWLAVQIVLRPFNDSNGNASEVVSRSTYIAVTLVGLLVALDVSGSSFLNTYVLYFFMVISYGGNVWFLLLGFDVVQRFIQRRQKRLLWSIDLFSPHVDVEPWSSIHVKRRIWQETLSTVLMTSDGLRMPLGKKVLYSEARNGSWPPYAIDFKMTVGERHAENLKILREIGSEAYYQALDRSKQKRWDALRDAVFPVGPDCYFRPSRPPFPPGVTTFFGNAWLAPFPLTLVIRYDQCSAPQVLNEIDELENYLAQNARSSIEGSRMLRAVLRSLEGQTVRWPFTTSIGRPKRPFAPKGVNGRSPTIVTYPVGTLEIRRQGSLAWKGHELGSGFDVRVKYGPDSYADAAHIGLTDDMSVNARLSTFLDRNGDLVDDRVPAVLGLLADYRSSVAYEAARKAEVMTYGFLRDVYDKLPTTAKEIECRVRDSETNDQLLSLAGDHAGAFSAVQQRLHAVFRSRSTSLWYLFWDDLWRRNSPAIALLRKHHTSLSPFFPASIAYHPCSRSKLVTFLVERGLWPEKDRRAFFGDHVLNLLYFALNEVQFGDVPIHFGSSPSHHFLSTLAHASSPEAASPTAEAGVVAPTYSSVPGTDYSSSLLLPRAPFEWECAYLPPRSELRYRIKGWVAGVLGLGKYEGRRGHGARLALDLEVLEREEGDGGRYVPLAGRDGEVERS